MKQILVTSTLIAFVAFLLAIGGSPLVFASTVQPALGTGSISHVSSSVSPLLTIVPVTLSFSPKTIHVAPGGSGTNTLTVTDKGTFSYTFTSCLLYYKLSTATKYTKGTCTLGGPITVSPGSPVKVPRKTTAGSSTPAGTYNLEVFLTNSADKSGAGKYNLVVS